MPQLSKTKSFKIDTQEMTLPSIEDVYDSIKWISSIPNPPRPPNGFILFRSWMIRARRSGTLKIHQSVLSSEIAEKWRSAPSEVRAHFGELATGLKAQHADRYPNYKFQPSKSKKKSGLTNTGGMDSPAVLPGEDMDIGGASHDLTQPVLSLTLDLAEDPRVTGMKRLPESASSSPFLPTIADGATVFGPFWALYPPGFELSSYQEPTILSRDPFSGPSLEASGGDYASAEADVSDCLALESGPSSFWGIHNQEGDRRSSFLEQSNAATSNLSLLSPRDSEDDCADADVDDFLQQALDDCSTSGQSFE